MPFVSEAQRRWMWATNPEMARQWAHEHPGQKNLPYHKGDKPPEPEEKKKPAKLTAPKKEKPVNELKKEADLQSAIAALKSSTKVTGAMNQMRQPMMGGTPLPAPLPRPQAAFGAGQQAALTRYGMAPPKTAGMLSQGVGMLSRGLKWGGRMAGSVPLVGSLASAPAQGIAGVMQGAANGEGWKGMAARGAAGVGTGLISGPGLSMAAGVASDHMLNNAFAPPQAPSIQ